MTDVFTCPHAHMPHHMKGWEAIGLIRQGVPEPPLVRRLGYTDHRGKRELGTERFGPGETRRGLAGIEVHLSADAIDEAYVYVCGTTESGVRRGYEQASKLIASGLDEVWS